MNLAGLERPGLYSCCRAVSPAIERARLGTLETP